MRKLYLIIILVAAFLAINSSSVSALSSGDVVKVAGFDEVYYISKLGKRHVFPNRDIFLSWYPDFSAVKTITLSELQQYSLGENVMYRSGTYLVKIQSDPKVYALEPGGIMRWLSTEAIAKSLYGDNYQNLIKDLPDSLFFSYVIGTPITSAVYPRGTLVRYSFSTQYYYIDTNNTLRKLSNQAFADNQFNLNFLRFLLTSYSATTGSDIVGKESLIGDLILSTSEKSQLYANANINTNQNSNVNTNTNSNTNINSNTNVNINASYQDLRITSLLNDEIDAEQSDIEYNWLMELRFSNESDHEIKITKLTLNQIGTGNIYNLDNVRFDGDVIAVKKPTNIFEFTFSTPLVIPYQSIQTYVIDGFLAIYGSSVQLELSSVNDLKTENPVNVIAEFPLQGRIINITQPTYPDVSINLTAASISRGTLTQIGSLKVNLADCESKINFVSARITVLESDLTGSAGNMQLAENIGKLSSSTFSFTYLNSSLCDVAFYVKVPSTAVMTGITPKIAFRIDDLSATYEDTGKTVHYSNVPYISNYLNVGF